MLKVLGAVLIASAFLPVPAAAASAECATIVTPKAAPGEDQPPLDQLACADLRGFDFSQKRLAGADLHGSNLAEVSLVQADLTGANLRGAVVGHLVFVAIATLILFLTARNADTGDEVASLSGACRSVGSANRSCGCPASRRRRCPRTGPCRGRRWTAPHPHPRHTTPFDGDDLHPTPGIGPADRVPRAD